VPDPYYGGAAGFDHALDLIEAASRALLADLTGEEKAQAKKGGD
jgi:protein-tyrosine phosphatase